MTNIFPFAASLLSWQLANYALCSDPIQDGENLSAHWESGHSRTAWFVSIACRSLACAILTASVFGFTKTSCLLASVVLAGSIILPLARRYIVPIAMLAEFELIANIGTAFIFWIICTVRLENGNPWWLPNGSTSKTATACICAALLIFVVRGGSLFVRGILEKAGGLPTSHRSGKTVSLGYKHGAMIGQIERIIVVLVVMMGSYETLAFFFAAKGLIRSKELDDRAIADYFLLGSLSSFLVALVGGLAMKQVVAAFWK
jgi:hypothetical protein